MDADGTIYDFLALTESGTPMDTFDEATSQRIVQFWKDIAAKTGSHILAGRLERLGDKLYNKATVFSPSGEILADYVKMHLFLPL